MRTALSLIFFLSGISALVYETLWFRLAGLSLGNSVWSVSLVLAAFMGGIALGNAVMARFGRLVSRPLMLYVALEIAIGIAGIAVVVALPQFPGWLSPLLGNLIETPWLLNLVRLSVAFVVLVAPATAMGATLPVLAQALSRIETNFGAILGQLYGWNTLGAMLGALATEVVLIKWFGLLGSGLTAMLLNFVAAFLAFRLAQAEQSPAAPATAAEPHSKLSWRSYRYLLVAFLSGLTLLALEVVWFRFLLLSNHGTSLIFAVMLALVLAGIALGGLISARLYRASEHCHEWLRYSLASSGALIVLTYYGFDLFTVRQFDHTTTTLEFVLFAAFLMLPVSVLSGIAFTLVGRALKEEAGTAIRTTAIATLSNTLGAMLGSLLAGFVLLPLAGMELSFFILALVYGVTALVAPVPAQRQAWWRSWPAYTSLGLLALCLLLFPFGLMERSFFRMVMADHADHRLVETREGPAETAFYYRSDLFGEPLYYRLVTNGFSMSATYNHAQRYMKLFVYLPMALKHDARNALLISYGVGATAKAITDTAGLENIDIVDISRNILEMSANVYADGENPLQDERVRVHIEDGRFFLNATERRYDLITSEPPPPKIAGVVNLYSQEYFQLIHKRLNVGGYASYWLPVHSLEPLDTLAIIKAFCNAFEDCSLWDAAGLDWMLMGSNGAASGYSLEQFSAQWDDAVVRSELNSLGLETPAQLGALFMGDAAMLTELTRGVAPVTDNHPQRISTRHAEAKGRYELYALLMDGSERLERFKQSEFIANFWPAGLMAASESLFPYERLYTDYFTVGQYHDSTDPFLWEDIDEVLTDTNLKSLPLWMLGSDEPVQRIIDTLRQGGGNEYAAEIELEMAKRRTMERDYAAALTHIRSYIRQRPAPSLGDYSFFLYLLGKNGELAEARAVVDGIDPGQREGAGVRAFLDWFAGKYY
jgi:spermidine synthase